MGEKGQERLSKKYNWSPTKKGSTAASGLTRAKKYATRGSGTTAKRIEERKKGLMFT